MHPREKLIFALDVPDAQRALTLVAQLQEEVGLFKVGLELFCAEGQDLLRDLAQAAGPGRIFLDLKLYDVPATVLGALHSILPDVALITLPLDLGPAALEKIVAARGGAYKILAVTVLTSQTAADLKALGYDRRYVENPTDLVVRKAKLAREAGCHGVVCSGQEVKAVKEACGKDFLVVTPGIRPAWAMVSGDDQKRIVTPVKAVINGADYLVVGRPIRTAPDPAAAARRVVDEIAAALADDR